MRNPKYCVFRYMEADDSLLMSKVCFDLQQAIEYVKNSNLHEYMYMIVPLDFNNSLSVHVLDNKVFIN